MTDDTISLLRRRMVEDMTVRGFTACTQRGYIAAVRRFTVFVGRSPDQATAEDLRRFQLQMRVEGASSTTMNAAVSALRFFFGVTLSRGDAEVALTTVREPRRLPVVLSRSEEHTSELQSLRHLVCRLLLEKKKKRNTNQ